MDWLTPTRRVVRWSPLGLAAGLAIGALAALRIADRPPRTVELTLSSVMVVIGALCGLHEPARDFVHALPVPASRRLLQRLAMIVPASALALAVVRWMSSAWFEALPPSPGWAALTGFGTVGLALWAVLTRRIGTRATDAAVTAMVVWLVVAVSADGLDAPLGLVMPWWRWPLAVASIAGVVAVIAVGRGVEA
jgi:hypothetical protein